MKLQLTISLGDVIAIVVPICSAIIGAAWSVLRKMDRFLLLQKEYPPHKHVGDEISYPKEYEPGKVEPLHKGIA